MAQEPKRPADEKVGAYDKPEKRGGGASALVTIVLVALAILLILWLFTDIL